MLKLDMHFHSKLSDGRLDNEDILRQAKDKGMSFVACTEHDIINTDFPMQAKKAGIDSLEGVEISSFDNIHGQYLHLTCYSKKFSTKVHSILKESREGRQRKMMLQVELLRRNSFDIVWEEYIEFFKSRGININNLNSSHLSSYIFTKPHNIDHLHRLVKKRLDRGEFVRDCLKSEGKYPWIGAVTIAEYEPPVRLIGKLAKDNNAVLSLAHPNFKLTKKQFKDRIGYYIDCGVNAIEINNKATPEWVSLILKYSKIHSFLVTFGSDCHFKEGDDKEHGEFGIRNDNITDGLVEYNFNLLKSRVGLIS